MSQNFELLTQIERESRTTDDRNANNAVCATAKAAVVPSSCYTGQEEMLQFVQRVFLSTDSSAHRQVVFCGVDGQNGSSSVCARAGRTLAAHTTRSVCMIDANLKSPRLSGMFGVNATTPSLGRSASQPEQCTQVDGNLWLAGTSMLADDRGTLISVDELEHRLAQLRVEFDYVLIDAPGTSACGDAGQLGRIADAAILVIEANSTRRLTARKAKETLDTAGVRLLGAVLHNRSLPIPERLYNRL